MAPNTKRTPADASVPQLIERERRHMPALVGVLATVALTGFITYWIPTHGVWPQWTYLLHTLTGIYLTLILIPYVRNHFRRTLGVRRPTVLISGIFAAVAAFLIAATGLYIAAAGQAETQRWVFELHVLLAYVVLGLLVAHILGHLVFSPGKRRHTELGRLPTLTASALRRTAIVLPAAGVIVLALTLIYPALRVTYRTQPAVEPYELSYGEHPFRPSQTETITNGFVDVRLIGGSRRCAACHEDVFKQWRASMHAQAASDQTYQTNVNLLASKKGMAATRYCEGCHAPVALLSGELTTGGRLDTHGHLHEGVSCLTCHGMDQIIHLKGVASYRFAGASDYLFANSDSVLATKIHNFLVRVQPRQHRADMARGILPMPQMCATCHTQFMDKDVNGWGWVKMQDDYTAWLDSPFSGQGGHTFSSTSPTRCQDCHMPKVAAPDPSADSAGMVRTHWFAAANSAVPYFTGDHEQLERVVAFLQSDKVRISFEHPTRSEPTRGMKPIDPSVANVTETPVYYYLGEEAELRIVVTNAQVGHNFPGGTLDINEAWVHFRVVDAENNVVYESGGLTEGNDVDPQAHFYRSLKIDRYGKLVWRHDLFNMIGDSIKKVVPAGGSDIVTYRFTIPPWAKSPLTATAIVRYRKLNNRYARWALRDAHIRLPIVDLAQDTLTITLRDKPEATPVSSEISTQRVRLVTDKN